MFGAPSLQWNGEPVSVSVRPLCLVLLAMIVTAEPGRRLSREAVAAELWPQDERAVAAANLRRHLSFLTAALPDAECVLGRDRDSLWWKPEAACWCDVVEFSNGAFELYGADFMEGFEHEWVIAQRERLRRAAVEGLTQRAEALREDDDYEGAIACARRAASIDPDDEEPTRLEIELLGERGDLQGMERAFGSLQLRLRDLDASPSPATVELVERFRRLARDAGARLPRPATSYVGSGAAENLAALLPAHRLISIVGPGGVGKTRLALEIAHRAAPAFADGAFFVDLSSIVEGDAVADVLSRTIGVPTDIASAGFTGIQRFLSNRRTLLLLDNCELVVESCAWFVSGLLEAAPHVHVLATSREAFGLRAELRYPLAPLSPHDAAALFVERVRSAAWGSGELAGHEARVGAICERLDRLPLAIELAASMLGTLSLADVERQLTEGFGLLPSRDPTVPQRQRSLDDVIEWSIAQLGADDRAAFARLGVFARSFSAEAARTVCGVAPATLSDLVSKSILIREDPLEGRFSFLVTIGDYARKLLAQDPRLSSIRDAHAAWYANLAARSNEPAFWQAEGEWLREIDRDFPSITQALHWCLFDSGSLELGSKLAYGLWRYFARRGYRADGTAWVQAALDRAPAGSLTHAKLLLALSILARPEGRELALEQARAAAATFSQLGSERNLALALNSQAALLMHLARTAEAEPLLERVLDLARRCGDVRTENLALANVAYLLSFAGRSGAREMFALALAGAEAAGAESTVATHLNSIAALDFIEGKHAAANERLERALAICRALDDVYPTAGILSDLGDVALMQGDGRRAAAFYGEALDVATRFERGLTTAKVLAGIAALAARAGSARDAARLLGAARLEEWVLVAPIVLVLKSAKDSAEGALGSATFSAELSLGRDMARRDVLTLARSALVAASAPSETT